MKKIIDKTKWFTEGFAILKEDGFNMITIESLCKRLKVTKGSFYHHFKNMDDYTQFLMEYWLHINTLSIIEETKKIESITERRNAIRFFFANISHKIEQAIRAWGYFNAQVNGYVQEADNIRIQYLTDLNIEEDKPLKTAEVYARLAYSGFVGIQQLFPAISPEDLKILNEKYGRR